MEKLYCNVIFPFGTYVFYTFKPDLKFHDTVLCQVRGDMIAGTLLGYRPDPGVKTKPCYGSIEDVLNTFDRDHDQWLRDQDEKKVEKFEKSKKYKQGHSILLNGLKFTMNEKGHFICVGRA